MNRRFIIEEALAVNFASGNNDYFGKTLTTKASADWEAHFTYLLDPKSNTHTAVSFRGAYGGKQESGTSVSSGSKRTHQMMLTLGRQITPVTILSVKFTKDLQVLNGTSGYNIGMRLGFVRPGKR